MRFANPEFLYAIPFFAAFIAWAARSSFRRRRKLIEKFAGGPDRSWAESGGSTVRRVLDFILFGTIVAALLVTLARPMYFAPDDRSELQGAPYLVALDASRSMLAADVDPSRYGAAVMALDRFFAEATSDHAGLITFAGVAYLNSPMTFDMTALRTILAYVNPHALVDPGSSLSAPLDRAARYFRSNSIPERTIVLISDGEELDGQSVMLARRLRREQNVAIHTIGVGTPAGAPIAAWRNGTYRAGNNAREIVTKLDEANLRRIANAGGGKYFRLGSNGEGLRRLREEVLKPMAEKMARNDLRNYHEAFYAPLAVAILALLARLALGGDRKVRRKPLPSILNSMTAAHVLVFAIVLPVCAKTDVDELQERLSAGKAEEVRVLLTRAINNDPKNPHLLYNRAVALYALGKYDDALVDLDLVEESQRQDLAKKAQFQKGNAQYQVGVANLDKDVELTLARWRQAIGEYGVVLKTDAAHRDASRNQAFVRKRMLELLLKMGGKNLETAEKAHSLQPKIDNARAAMEQFHEATEMDQQNEPAKQGEERARDLLANALANEGERKTMTTNMVAAARNEPPIPRPDTKQIQEGVNMLEDAHDLKPKDQAIAQKLEQGRDRLADALTQQAQIYQRMEPRIARLDEKLGILRMSMELLEKALSDRPDHEMAQQTLEQVKERLAQIHEQEGDQLEQRSERASLEQQAQDLSNALDHFQQGAELQPQQPQLPQKAQRAQSKLEQALEQLGDKLMQPKANESLDQQVMRMEGASQAFNELESLKPTPQVSEKARAASQQLEKLRQQLAEKGQQPQQPGQQQGLAMMPPQNDLGVPMDSPPKLDAKGKNGRYQSGAMNRNLRDY
ncbi:MAG TPA: VWA domain-containing protein [Verrucomicrobiae bacterium]|nr:VWA domain-containing protein [Verrucomicrobiae bacterium]